MWGDPEKALALNESDALAAILQQICGPAHVSWQDSRWHELLHAYGVWMHVESRLSVVQQATSQLILHSPQSSNLAALCIHVTRLVNDLLPVKTSSLMVSANVTNGSFSASSVDNFSNRIAMVAKARTTAGSLNLLRLLIHAVMVHSCSLQDPCDYLKQVFTYRSRDSNGEHAVASDLVEALVKYLIQLHLLLETQQSISMSSPPELYDATTCVLQLLLVLFSSQLYSPLQSSLSRPASMTISGYYFWDMFMQQARDATLWTPRQLLAALLNWTIQRPVAPERSVQLHLQELVRSVAASTHHHVGVDGMYETHVVVLAEAPQSKEEGNAQQEEGHLRYSSNSRQQQLLDPHRQHNFLLDATKGVVRTLSSTILLLPLRLLSLALNLFHSNSTKEDYDKHYLRHQLKQQRDEHLTRDVLWITSSPIADLATCLLLLVSNNERRMQQLSSEGNVTTMLTVQNPFRDELAQLTDNRWHADGNSLPDLPNLTSNLQMPSEDVSLAAAPLLAGDDANERAYLCSSMNVSSKVLSVNFEALFKSVGLTAHTEVGALLLYTLLQASQTFADSLAVRSDLDTLVLPLLRTLYISTSLKNYAALDFAASHGPNGLNASNEPDEPHAMSIRSCPFRSLSHLYVIIILLLLFSQDLSFGSDAFRRVMVANVNWYKERNIKDINLGSVLVLCLLRSLTFNLNRLHDGFLLSNACAILMNLSSSISDLHEYAAMRLASVTLSSMKRYALLKQDHPDVDEEDLSHPIAMHGEACRTLLQVVKQCFATKSIDRNLHLVYAMVYHQVEFKKLVTAQATPFTKTEVGRIQKLITAASSLLEVGNARTATKALKYLSENIEQLRSAVVERKQQNDSEAFTFTYEEEADPETFFVPYVWEIIVCCATASAIEWTKPAIKVFPLLEDPIADESIFQDSQPRQLQSISDYAKDLTEVA
ncbi:hypothetical protein MPSEU_000236800 [Mayamaea pseudoterrestris]|nr:hypothetical protein MPSEU_000236800 [Mayamaea pseudoterrestris]